MKRFRLDITGKLEDRPRLLRAYGKIPGGEVALVLRPTAYSGVLVHVTKDGATQWSAGAENVPADWPRVRVAVERGETTVLDGPLTGRVLNAPVLARGSGSVALGPDGQVELVDGDTPRVPGDVIDARTAVAALKRAQQDVPKAGASTLRGQWSGTLTWDAGPYVELRRKLAAYGSLVVNSGADGWRWRFEREAHWFASAGQEGDGPFATLVQAIDAGMLGALGLVRPACGVRDTRRRGAYDPAWAETHPLPEPKESSDPTERLRDRSTSETSQSERKIRRPSTDAVIEAANVPSVASVPRDSRPPRARSTPTREDLGTPDTDADSACGCSIGPAADGTAEAPVRTSPEASTRRSSRSGTSNARSSARSDEAAEATKPRGARSTRASSTGGRNSSKASSTGGNGGRSSRGVDTTASPRTGRSARPSSSGSGALSSGTTASPSPQAPAGSTDEASLIQAFSAAVAAALID